MVSPPGFLFSNHVPISCTSIVAIHKPYFFFHIWHSNSNATFETITTLPIVFRFSFSITSPYLEQAVFVKAFLLESLPALGSQQNLGTHPVTLPTNTCIQPIMNTTIIHYNTTSTIFPHWQGVSIP